MPKLGLQTVLLSLLTVGAVAVPTRAAVPQYQRTAISLPGGVRYGWTFHPEEAAPTFNQDALVIPDPQKSTTGRSGILSLNGLYSGTRTIYSLVSKELYSEPIGAVKADMDGDGTGDVVVWFRNRPLFRVLYGDKNSGPLRTYEDTLRLGSPDTLAVADLNGDGKPEILAWYGGLQYLMILWQEPAPAAGDLFRRYDLYSFKPVTNNPGLSGSRMFFGDFDGDGITDFVFSGYLFRGSAGGKFTRLTLSSAQQYYAVAYAADLDGNAVTELLMAKLDPAKFVLSLFIASLDSVGRISEKSAASYRTNLAGLSFVDYWDYDQNGLRDLLLGDRGTITVLSGFADGTFSSAADTLLSGSAGLRPLGTADWGLDGVPDWFFLNSSQDSLVVFSPLGARFVENTAQVGFDRKLAGNAVAVGDYNNDGRTDVFIQTGKGFNALFQGGADGKFTDVAAAAGVALSNDGISCAWGDYDNDGFPDLFVAGMNLPNKLFRNNGNGTFSDSSQVIGLDRQGQHATSVCWGDVNHDGWLDLLIANYDGPNWLLVNQNGRRFIDRSKDMGLTESYKTESAVLVDVDNDGWLDIVTLNTDGPVRLLKGGDKGFTDITATSGFNSDPGFKKFGQSQAWGDFNGDGYPDLYITRAQDVDALYMNSGQGGGTRFVRKFSDNIDGKYGRLGATIADLDEDSNPDLLIARTSVFGQFIARATDLFFSGNSQYPSLQTGIQPYQPVDKLGLQRTVDSSLPVAADFDGDGDLDVLFVNYLPDNSSDLFHGSALPLSYLENRGHSVRNLSLSLRREQNRSSIGTRVVLYSYNSARLQTVSGGDGRIQNGGALIYTLTSASIDSLVVYWPQGGRQTISGPISAGMLEVNEDKLGPVITAVPTADQWPLKGEITSTSGTIYINLDVRDPSIVSWVRAINLKTATSKSDTLYGQPLSDNLYLQPRRSPAPIDSLSYFIEASDYYGNISRLPVSGYYKLVNLAGDINSDGKIDVMDILRIIQIINRQGNAPSSEEIRAGDLNLDGKIDTLDLIRLLSLIGGGVTKTDLNSTVGTYPPVKP